MLDASSIRVVLEVYRPERSALLGLLDGLSQADWDRPTECREYTVKGVVTHVLGDDLSLLSRQRDGTEPGLSLLGPELPDADFCTLLDTFNDQCRIFHLMHVLRRPAYPQQAGYLLRSLFRRESRSSRAEGRGPGHPPLSLH
jgi:hypothetical protein